MAAPSRFRLWVRPSRLFWGPRSSCRSAAILAGMTFEDDRNARMARMARNEAASRAINEKVEGSRDERSLMPIVCECGLTKCDRTIEIALDEYREVRTDPTRFAVVPEHLIGDIERIVYENDRFVVVAKREGIPADIAREEAPRDGGTTS